MRGTEHVHYNFEAIDRAMSYLSMKAEIPDGESRVMLLVADFYVKLEVLGDTFKWPPHL
jgi:hypothetical protein